MITLSALGHAAACPGAHLLPQQQRSGENASLGRAIHELCETMVRGDHSAPPEVDAEIVTLAHQLDADDAGRLEFLATHLRLQVPTGALTEVSLGYFPDGSVRRIEGGAGHYPDVGQLLSGQIDCLWAEPGGLDWTGDENYWCHPQDMLFVPDYKTGDPANVTPLAQGNWQLRGAALLAARWTGAQRVMPAIVYINAADCSVAVREGKVYGGQWEVPEDASGNPVAWGPTELDKIERELNALPAIVAERERLRAREEASGVEVVQMRHVQSDVDGDGLRNHLPMLHPGSVRGSLLREDLITGPHCTYCDSRAHCPAFNAEALALARAAGSIAGLDSAAVAHAYSLVPAMRSAIAAIEDAARAHAEAAGGSLLLPGGKVYGAAVESVTSYRTVETFDVLVAVVGEERANEAAEFTGASIKRALAAAGAPRGAWRAVKEQLEAYVPPGWHPPLAAHGATVVTGREVWRSTWPAMPVEGGNNGEQGRDLRRADRTADDANRPDRERAQDPDAGGIPHPDAGESGPALHDAGGGLERGDAAGLQGGELDGGRRPHGLYADPQSTSPRLPCSHCSRPFTLTSEGNVRRHRPEGGGNTYCPGGRKPPGGGSGEAREPEQGVIEGA